MHFPYRYIAIRYPLRSRETRTPRNALTSISLVWALSLIFSSPYLSYYQQMDLDGTTVCIPVEHPSSSSHGHLHLYIRLPDPSPHSQHHVRPHHPVPLDLRGPHAGHVRIPQVQAQGDQDDNHRLCALLFMLAATSPGYLVMWFGHFPLNHTTYVLRILSHLVAYTNSCLNPIVYALVSKHFRKGFKKVFGCAFRNRVVNRIHTVHPVQTVSLMEAASSEGSNHSDGSNRGRLWSKSSKKMMTSAFMTFNVT